MSLPQIWKVYEKIGKINLLQIYYNDLTILSSIILQFDKTFLFYCDILDIIMVKIVK